MGIGNAGQRGGGIGDLRNTIGTHGEDVSTQLVIIGAKAETTVPVAVDDGDDVQLNYDEYGRHRDAGHDVAVAAESVTDIAPAKMQKMAPQTMTQLTAIGNTASIDTEDYDIITAQVTVAAIDTSVQVGIQGSLDDTNYGFISLQDNGAAGQPGITINGNVADITVDGTYFLTTVQTAATRARFRLNDEDASPSTVTADVILCAGN